MGKTLMFIDLFILLKQRMAQEWGKRTRWETTDVGLGLGSALTNCAKCNWPLPLFGLQFPCPHSKEIGPSAV